MASIKRGDSRQVLRGTILFCPEFDVEAGVGKVEDLRRERLEELRFVLKMEKDGRVFERVRLVEVIDRDEE